MTDHHRALYRGMIVDVRREEVMLPNGHRLEMEIVTHPGGAAVVALDADHRVCLLRHYRHVAGDWLWELPAGKRDAGEPPLETARRELAEEAGLAASAWAPLGHMLSSPGVFTEAVHLFLARDLTPARPVRDAEEVFEVHWLPLANAVERALAGEIADAKTVIGLVRARHHLST